MDLQQIQAIKQRFGIIGNSPKLNYAIQVAIQVATTDLSVLITSESGSGKETFSKIIHQLSHRKHGQFIAVNCGAIPEGTINSELFGHEKGAFTGATEARKGYFEVTHEGTIFLDEIAETPLETQVRLLRVLENKEFIKVGSSKIQKTNVRIVAATNADLLEKIEDNKFREDLYFRLNTVPIYVPVLRERGNDIELLFRYFASDFAERYKVKSIILNEEAKQLLLSYRFPGNIRQLKNLAEQISVLHTDRNITKEILQGYLPESRKSRLPTLITRNERNKDDYTERDLLYKILFDMRKDVTDLKKLVLNMLQSGRLDTNILKENKNLFSDIKNNNVAAEIRPSIPVIPTPVFEPDPLKTITQNLSQNGITPTPISIDNRFENITHEAIENESLSIQDKEKELIIKALKKNNNKRKYAAQNLGISERTLYRKIKQYEIDD